MHGCFYGNIFGFRWAGWWMEIFLTVLVIVGIVYLVSRLFRRQQSNFDSLDSLDILKRRLASGEITMEEFEKLKRFL